MVKKTEILSHGLPLTMMARDKNKTIGGIVQITDITPMMTIIVKAQNI